MATLYSQYQVQRFLTWEEVRDGGGFESFTSTIVVGGQTITTSGLSTVSGGFHLFTLVALSLQAPPSSERGFAWNTSPGDSYWAYNDIQVPDGTIIPPEYLTGVGEPPDDDTIWDTFVDVAADAAETLLRARGYANAAELIDDALDSINLHNLLADHMEQQFDAINLGMGNQITLEQFNALTDQNTRNLLNGLAEEADLPSYVADAIADSGAYVETRSYDPTTGGYSGSIGLLQPVPDGWTLYGGSAVRDGVIGSAEDDVISLWEDNDFAYGGDGDDLILGGPGEDTLLGGLGADNLQGGEDSDLLHGGPGGDQYFGGAGKDFVSYAGSNGGVTVSLIAETGFGGHAGGDALYQVENLIGSRFSDHLTGARSANQLEGKAGSDSLFGLGGGDFLTGGAAQDFLNGGGGNDQLLGGRGKDVLKGGGGHDTLIGGASNDTLVGKAGVDWFVFGPGDGTDRIKDFTDGVDFIDLTAFNFASVKVAKSFATNVNGNVVFDFVGNAQLIVEDITKALLTGDDILV